MQDEALYDYFGIDPKEFKYMKKQAYTHKRAERRTQMIQGEIPPADENFFKLKTDDIVYVQVSMRTPIIEGRVRMAHANDSYVVEHETDGILTWAMMLPDNKITSTKPYIFDIGMPNHHKVFRIKKDLEMATVDFLMNHSSKSQIPIATLIGQIKIMLEKYPEEFI